MNLLDETKMSIEESGHTPADIVFIGSQATGHQCSWEYFCTLADVDYDAGYGAQEVASDLIIVFNDGQQMRRGEYDGSEWWEFSKPFVKPPSSLPITRLTVKGTGKIGWKTIEELCTA